MGSPSVMSMSVSDDNRVPSTDSSSRARSLRSFATAEAIRTIAFSRARMG